jgi:hypothetical protein
MRRSLLDQKREDHLGVAPSHFTTIGVRFERAKFSIIAASSLDCHHRAVVVIKPVSADSLHKTGMSADKAEDLGDFPPQDRPIGSPEIKSRPAFAALLRAVAKSKEQPHCLAEAGNSNSDMASWNRILSPVREKPQNF